MLLPLTQASAEEQAHFRSLLDDPASLTTIPPEAQVLLKAGFLHPDHRMPGRKTLPPYPTEAEFPYVPGIPRRIHQIALGPRPISKLNQTWMDGLQALHPDWTYRLWRDDDLEEIWAQDPFGLKNAFERAYNYGFQSDLLRLLLEWLYGGFYLDLDCWVLKALDPLLTAGDGLIGETFAGQTFDNIAVENAILAFAPRHPFLTQVLRSVVAAEPGWPAQLSRKDPVTTVYLTGPGMLSRELEEYRRSARSVADAVRHDVTVIARRFLFPFGPSNKSHTPNDFPEAFLLHGWEGSWI